SVAMDDSHYPPGIMGILTSRRPFFDKEGRLSWQPFGRLVTHQDSGAAIKGRHRLDLYMGSGPQNGQAAGLMKEEGNFVMLIPNLSFQHVHSIIGTGNHITLSPQGEKRSP
ncbi:MAG: 3D domain-containing protein, partial [Deltaproteobacteria bacterium]|nr:3D domain-containing protein [Deltaproteobacteria bacterium]